jgi:putative ABC transport system permease protein
MELGPIFRALLRNKTRFALISLEVALTLAIIVNCVNMMQDLLSKMERPTGIVEAEILVVRSTLFAPEFREEGYRENSRKADLALLRALPGVKAADSFDQIPLSGSGNSSGYKPLHSKMDTLPCNVFTTGVDGMATLGVRLVQGRNLVQSDINKADSKNVIITKAYADSLFPDGDALGKLIQGREPENPHTIVGIIEQMHGSWPNWRYLNNVMLRPGEPGSFNWGHRYMVRVDPAALSSLIPVIEKDLLTSNNGRNVEIRPLAEIKARTYEANLAIARMLAAVIGLLLFVTALGIVGITSFSVTERTHHIGTRRALGARRADILRYFLTENWAITTIGLAVGLALTYGLNYALVQYLDSVKLQPRLVVFAILGMWLIGQAATFLPAWKGARTSPAVATRNV